MSKKVLIISASPRAKGNSDILCDEFMRGAQDAGHSVEKVRITDSNINYCTGCCSCIGNSGSCVQNDDMNEIMTKFVEADAIVLATPVYFRSMNGQMKTFIDRICPVYPIANNKDFYFIISAAGGQFPVDETVKSLEVFTDCLSGSKTKAVISSTGIWGEDGVKGKPVMQEAFNAGKNV